jgi:hypothetical protein
MAMSEYRQKGSKRSYPGSSKKGRDKQRSLKKPDNDAPGLGMDVESFTRRYTREYGK